MHFKYKLLFHLGRYFVTPSPKTRIKQLFRVAAYAIRFSHVGSDY
jgi:hypothetical protein